MIKSQKMLGLDPASISIFKNFKLIALCCCILILSYLSYFNRPLLKYIPVSTQQLKRVATVRNYDGDVRRKVVDDILWLPATQQMQLFLGDSVFSNYGSAVEIIFDADHSVFIGENSLVKIGSYLDKPLIDIIRGEIKVDYKDDKIVYVKEADGIKEKPIAEFKSPAHEKPKPKVKVKTEILKPADTVLADAKNLLQLYPQNNAVFLSMGAGQLALSSGQACTTECSLTLKTKNGDEVKRFKAGQIATLPIAISRGQAESYQWVFIDGETQVSRQFQVLPYSKSHFDQAVKNKSPVEILTE